jgi:hypothetical protein
MDYNSGFCDVGFAFMISHFVNAFYRNNFIHIEEQAEDWVEEESIQGTDKLCMD